MNIANELVSSSMKLILLDFDESLPILEENCSKRVVAVRQTTSITRALF